MMGGTKERVGSQSGLLGYVVAIAVSALAANAAQAVSFCVPGPGDRPEPGLQGAVSLEERTAPGGFQGHW